MQLIFKSAGAEDIPIISGLARSIWEKHYPSIISHSQIDYMLERYYSGNALLAQMQEGQMFTLVLEENKPIGFSAHSLRSAGNFFMHKFYIDPERHKHGIGKRLFEFVFMQMKDPSRIELTVNRKNFKAINFYFKIGFSIDRCEDFDIGNGFFMNDFVMCLRK